MNNTFLYELEKDEKAIILGISNKCIGDERRRLLDLGFVKGTEIRMLSKSPLGNPIAYRLRGTLIALRNEQAKLIYIQKIKNDD